MKPDTDFEILREYGEAIKDKSYRSRLRNRQALTLLELEDFKEVTKPFLQRLLNNMGHGRGLAFELLRDVTRL